MFWFKRRKQQSEIQRVNNSVIERLGNRRHLKNVPYLFPKDMGDQNRLDLQHFMVRHVLHGNYLAPIDSPHRILDVACGTGRWGSEMAHEFPMASVIGFDLEPPLESSNSVRLGEGESRSNYSFVKGDMTAGLPFPDNSFDFVHMRFVVIGIQRTAWLPVIKDLYRITTPGGWIELVDGMTSMQVKSQAGMLYQSWFDQICENRQFDIQAGLHLGDYLRMAGLQNIQHLRTEIPMGSWRGSSGRLMASNLESGIKGLKGPIVQMGLTTNEVFDQTLHQMIQDIESSRFSIPIFIAFGQKN